MEPTQIEYLMWTQAWRRPLRPNPRPAPTTRWLRRAGRRMPRLEFTIVS